VDNRQVVWEEERRHTPGTAGRLINRGITACGLFWLCCSWHFKVSF
jgi:hypothetical protein